MLRTGASRKTAGKPTRAVPRGTGDRGSIEALLTERRPDHVTFEGWQAIDAAEVEAGKPHGRPRVKLCRVDELVEASKAKTAA